MAITFSIVVAETALWLAAVAWGASWLLRETGGTGPPRVASPSSSTGDLFGLVGAPIVVFFALSLLSVMASRDRVEGLFELREIFLFAAPIVTWALWRDADAQHGPKRVSEHVAPMKHAGNGVWRYFSPPRHGEREVSGVVAWTKSARKSVPSRFSAPRA